MIKTAEGLMNVPGGRIWYRIGGTGDGTPLIILHGGPGLGHDYLTVLEVLGNERPVVFFDQLGSGRSDVPEDESLWRLDRFVSEVESLRLALDLPRFHLLGHSFGGWLALEYTLARPEMIDSLVLSSTSASVREYIQGLALLRSARPRNEVVMLDKHAARGEYDAPAYNEALMGFFTTHICRLDPWPDELMRSFTSYCRSPAPEYMLGPDYFSPDGNLVDWDRESDLFQIESATLVMCGRHDSIVPSCSETLARGIPNADLRVFENASHMAHLEASDAYIRTLRSFLSRSDGTLRGAEGDGLKGV